MQHIDPEELRKATDLLMKKLQEMSGQEYVDIYASQAKEAMLEEKRRKKEDEDSDEDIKKPTLTVQTHSFILGS